MKTKMLTTVLLLTFHAFVQSASGQITGIVASYTFSGNANDESGNGNNAQLVGNATANGVLKLANNNTNYLLLPAAIINGKTDFSISMKIKFKGFHKSGSSPTNHILTGSSTSLDRIGFSYERINQTWRLALNGVTYSFPDLLVTEVWYCVIVTREGNQARLYVDGVLVGTVTVNTTAIPCTSLLIGQEEDCSGGCFAKNQCTNGQIDKLVFYDHALTLMDAQTICNNSSAKNDPLPLSPMISAFYPNPAHDFLFISYDAATIETVEIYNLMGEKVAGFAHSNRISIAGLQPGMYLIKVTSTEGMILSTGKFIKE
ncbi:MAG: LamG-like jellyroll fold domain-containing protein [Chitinophagales bacterium]